MVAQLRAFTGIEAWLSTEPDVAALKDAAKKLDDTLWADETGPPPPQRNLLDDSEMVALDGVDGGNLEMEAALTSEPALAAQPAPSTSPPAPPAQSTHHGVDTTVNQLVYQPTVQNTLVKNTARLGDPSQGARRGASILGLSAPRTPRSRSLLHYLDQSLKDY